MRSLEKTYGDFFDCLKERRWNDIGAFLHGGYVKNEKPYTGDSFAAELQTNGHMELELDAVTVDEEGGRLVSSILMKWEPNEPVNGFDPPPRPILYMEQHFNWFVDGRMSKTVTISNQLAVHSQLSNPQHDYTPDVIGGAHPGQEGQALSAGRLEEIYRKYVDCVNTRTIWDAWGDYVHPEVIFNGKTLSLDEYRQYLDSLVMAVPNLAAVVHTTVADERTQRLAAQLEFSGLLAKPIAGLDAVGTHVRFAESCTYQFRDGKIARLWSIARKT